MLWDVTEFTDAVSDRRLSAGRDDPLR